MAEERYEPVPRRWQRLTCLVIALLLAAATVVLFVLSEKFVGPHDSAPVDPSWFILSVMALIGSLLAGLLGVFCWSK